MTVEARGFLGRRKILQLMEKKKKKKPTDKSVVLLALRGP